MFLIMIIKFSSIIAEILYLETTIFTSKVSWLFLGIMAEDTCWSKKLIINTIELTSMIMTIPKMVEKLKLSSVLKCKAGKVSPNQTKFLT